MIFDRSYIDIINARKVFANTVQNFRELAEPEQRIIDRAFFNLTALNRIIAKINEIWGLVVTLGGVKVESADVREWSKQEIFTINNFANIRGNIGEILSQIHEWSFIDFQPLQDAYETINYDYSYTNLNTLEKLLFDIYNELEDANIEVVTNYLTFSSPSGFTLNTQNKKKNWNGILEYSTDTSTWSEWNGATTLSAGSGKLYLRGTGNTKITGGTTPTGTSDNPYKWVLSGSNITCEGNIENLLDYATVSNGGHPTMANYCFANMFEDCTSLITAPALSATTLSGACYYFMFVGCSNLVTPPELPATKLESYCYYRMFAGTGLIEAPTLPATTLAGSCYSGMFLQCSNLIKPPALPATKLESSCYSEMFMYCTSLEEAPALPATTLAPNCYFSMFRQCKKLKTIPALPATTLAQQCYYRMFFYCSELKITTYQNEEYKTPYRIPTSGTGTTATDALYEMFALIGGSVTDTPSINTTYYTSNTVV